MAVLSLTAVPSVVAQPASDRRVGPDEFGNPIVITAIEPKLLGAFARAAGVPMGIEVVPGTPRKAAARTLTGLTVHEAFLVMSAVDSRYEWREMNDVIVLRAPAAWNRPSHPLHARVQPVLLPDIRGRNALSLIAAFLGAPQYRNTQLGDTKRFSLRVEAGTVLDVLNATVSAHGEMAWAFENTRTADSIFPFIVTLFSGSAGYGCGVPGQSPEQPLDVSQYADAQLFSVGGSAAVLDRIVGNGPNERTLVVIGPYPSAVAGLANATKIPMGIEFLGPGNRPLLGEIPATGRTLRDVLNAMVSIDPRYEWREMEGVIVIRPTVVWNDPDSVFFRLVPSVQMDDVSPQEAIERVARELGYSSPLGGIPHGKRLSIHAPQGSLLDLVNAVLRAHGELTWTLEPETPADAERSGYRYRLTFGVMGGGGLGVGVR
jgi:hypothetical protein